MMKYLLILAALISISITATAQTQVRQCIIENGTLKTVVADYDPATGVYSVMLNGTKKAFDDVYPPTGIHYAQTRSWFINNEKISFNGKKYIKYGLPRILGTTEIKKISEFDKIGVYVEQGLTDNEVIYLPTRRGCEFQPYRIDVPLPKEKTIYYDKNWKVSSEAKAAYYRIVNVNPAGQPVGLVRDYYIDGKKQWQGRLSHLDPYDNSKDVMDGVCAWFDANGTKIEEAYYINGKQEGVYKSWSEDGSLMLEIEFKNGKMNGYSKTYTADGQLLKTEYYANGVLKK
ncbi:MAG TPA: hypothetical protein VMR70_20670 [Flavisolibacter sp.]|nr:hypothetical protein [Flavisolibacter sp.]